MGYELDFGALAGYLGLFLHGLGVTLGLTAISASLGIALSIGGAATAGSGRRCQARAGRHCRAQAGG